jgi:spore maturation protein CgeB
VTRFDSLPRACIVSSFIVNYRQFRPIAEGLRACGYTVYEDTWNPTNEQLADCDGYLICMYNAMKRPVDTFRLKSRLRRYRIPLIGWNRDAPWNKGAKRWRLWWFRKLRMLDIYAAHSLQGAELFSREPIYLPNAAWTTGYNLAGHTLNEMRDPGFYRYDVSFIGNLDAERYPEFTERTAFINELEARLRSCAVSTCFRQGLGMPVAEQVEIIQRSRININFGAACDDGREKSWGLPERCYGVPACGGFLLSDFRKHAPDDFEPGQQWVSFGDLDDCVDKVRFYLNRFDEARAIAERAHTRVMRDHTYTHRAARLVDAARRWRECRTR